MVVVGFLVDLLSWASIIVGGGFCLIGGLGMLRMPDLYTRMHAAGLVDTGGLLFLTLGMVLQTGFSLLSVKLLLIVAFILYTSPVSTHALAQAALSTGFKPLLHDGEKNPAPEKKELELSKT